MLSDIILLKTSEFVTTMNRLGEQRRPFLFVIDYEGLEPLVCTPGEAREKGIWYSLPKFTGNGPGINSVAGQTPAFRFENHPVSFETYRRSFNKVMKHILQGDTYLLNLTFPTPVESNLTLEDIYRYSKSRYKILMPGRFVVFSPETFVKIENGKIYTFPMKGTIDAAVPDAGTVLLNDPKEKSEHNTIVDLLRNDLGMVASNIVVEKFRYLEKIKTNSKTLIQVSSMISGRLERDYASKIGDIMASLLPAGSVTGAPKKKTLEIIREAETYERGFFTGVFGYFDGENMDSAVMIRFIEQTSCGLVAKSGGGITFNSDPETEYREMIDKVYVPFH